MDTALTGSTSTDTHLEVLLTTRKNDASSSAHKTLEQHRGNKHSGLRYGRQQRQRYSNGLSGDWDVSQVTEEATMSRNKKDVLAVQPIFCLPF